jgi:hypothetical protein
MTRNGKKRDRRESSVCQTERRIKRRKITLGRIT